MSNTILTSKNIKDLLKRKKWKKKELADMLGVSTKTISRWTNEHSKELPSGTAGIVLTQLISTVLDKPMPNQEILLMDALKDSIEVTEWKNSGDIIYSRLAIAEKSELEEICNALEIDEGSSLFDISKHYRSAAGNSIRNLFRGDQELPYKRILVGCLNKINPDRSLKYHFDDDYTEEDLEDSIFKIYINQISKELNDLSYEERIKKVELLKKKMNEKGYDTEAIEKVDELLAVAGAITSTSITALFTVPLTSTIFYSGTLAGIWVKVFGVSSTLLSLTAAGLSVATALPFITIYLSMPNYKKTIPTTLQLIGIRRRYEEANFLLTE